MMILWLAALAALILWRARIVSFHEGFLEKETTDSIKGIFIFIVLLSHMRGYIAPGESFFNSLYASFFTAIGQLMVAMFLFYSGYGCCESFRKKENYLRDFMKNRVGKTLVNFAAALLLYVILNILFRIPHTPREYLLCWIGWESIGNSNWYIFTILALYCMAWIGFKTEEKTFAGASAAVVTLLCFAFILLMRKAGKESWWYDTALCFPTGMAVSHFADRIRESVKRPRAWLAWTAAAASAFLATYFLGGAFFLVCACLFCLLLMLLTAKLRIGNAALAWMGRHLFEIYILQRIPMIVLSELSVSDPMLFSALTIATAMAAAGAFHVFLVKLDSKLFSAAKAGKDRK